MAKKKKTIAVIPARGGSKSIPKKNIIPINGKPLITYTIEAAVNSSSIHKTVVSSDDDEILEISKDHGAHIIKRPAELATDTALPEDALIHALADLKKQGENYEILVLLQPTSPLRTREDIDEAMKIFFENNATALISVYEPLHTPYKTFRLNDLGYLEGLIDNLSPFKRRQDLPKTFMPNGAIYIITVDEFLKRKSLLTDKTVHYLMPAKKSVDIDSMEDIKNLERILRRKR